MPLMNTVFSRATPRSGSVSSRDTRSPSSLDTVTQTMHLRCGGNKGNNQSGDTSNRGFASMDPQKQREIASEGGKAAHASGNAHEFTSEEARRAGSMSHKNDGSQQSQGGGSQQSGSGGGPRRCGSPRRRRR